MPLTYDDASKLIPGMIDENPVTPAMVNVSLLIIPITVPAIMISSTVCNPEVISATVSGKIPVVPCNEVYSVPTNFQFEPSYTFN